jgi:SAM-dependent methyltransferase
MSHVEQIVFLEITAKFFKINNTANLKILDLGSADYNGSSRKLFKSKKYIGVDVHKGPSVDLVIKPKLKLPFSNFEFNVVLSCNCFEHNPFWQKSFSEMYRVLKDKSFFILSTASRGRVEHGTKRTWKGNFPDHSKSRYYLKNFDYYKNLRETDFYKAFDIKNMFESYFFSYHSRSKDLFFVGIKSQQSNNKKSEIELDKLFTKIKYIDKFLPQPKTKTPKIFRKLFELADFPMRLLSFCLSDKNYQRFAIPYYNFKHKLNYFLKSFLKFITGF